MRVKKGETIDWAKVESNIRTLRCPDHGVVDTRRTEDGRFFECPKRLCECRWSEDTPPVHWGKVEQ